MRRTSPPRRRVHLARYLSPEVTEQLLRDPHRLELGGRRKEVTLLCARVHDLATVSERLEPEEIDELLQLIFSTVTEIVFRHRGTLDQFSGSGVRVIFGDPLEQPDHPLKAVRCALEVRARVHEMLRAWRTPGRPAVHVGFGVLTGYVTVGNVGTTARMEYTALGSNVNAAELLARDAGERIVVHPRTYSRTRDAVVYEPFGAGEEPVAYEAVTLRR